MDRSSHCVPCTILEEQKIAEQNFPLHMLGKFALQETKTLARNLLADGMMKGKPQPVVDDVVAKLSSRDVYFSHGSVIDHREATSIGLNIEYLKPDDPIWQRLWLLLCMYEHDCRKARYLKVFEGRARSLSIAAPPPPRNDRNNSVSAARLHRASEREPEIFVRPM